MFLRLRAVALAVVAVSCSPGVARAAIPVAVYPPRGGAGVGPDELTDVQSLLESALRAGVRRGVLAPATPIALAATCPDPAQDACVGKLAGSGRVLVSSVRPAGSVLAVTIALVDASGTRTKAVAFGVDPIIMSSVPAQQALAALETLVDERTTEKAVAKATATPASTATAAATATSTPTATPASTATPTANPNPNPNPNPEAQPQPDLRAPEPPRRALAVRDPKPPPPPAWEKTVAQWTAIGGLGLLALGGGVGYLDKRLADDLAADHARNALTPSDRARYDQVKTYNLAANVLFATGGVALATAGVFWLMAPDGPEAPGGRRNPPRFGVQGRF